MRVALMTSGSQGDVAPFTGLGAGLLAAGHKVTLVTHGRFEPLVADTGMRFHALPIDPQEQMRSEKGRALHRSNTGAGKLVRVLALARSLACEMADGLVEAAQGHDVIVASASLAPAASTIALGLGVPCAGAYLQPLHPTREFAPAMVSERSLGGVGNRLAAHAVDVALDRVYTDVTRDLRERLGLPAAGPTTARRARERRGWSVVYGYSPIVVPRPADWRPGLDPVGYWWPYDSRELPATVEDFLRAGPPPVFVGLGSATVPDPRRVSEQVVRALRAAGLRGIVQRGWADLGATGDDMLTVDDVPHHLLFPRVAAVVHHAGAGTAAAGLRAGVPSVPVPIQLDGAFWSDRLVRLGVAPAAVPLRRLTADTLRAALVEATGQPRYRDRAGAIAARLAAEDSVGPVDALVGRLAGGGGASRRG
ncbi:nucleotide disphospho-sugar-binding domain-containing protein [Embleya hyalina]|uniref:Glycosyl transferase n=1 Tax=Embleya hyalina TaxID=516124 RepID=A0A401YMF4_9ACTN|nr:glycosyltransferase [Embleya hyalina]GCD95792.1 glycosyl transferase [Embleya hyalina]